MTSLLRASWTGLFGCALLAALLTACGISYGDGDSETELFTDLTIGGDLVTGGRVALTLSYEQPYPVDVNVTCSLVASGGPDEDPDAVRPATADPEASPTPPSIPPPPQTPKHTIRDVLQATISSNPDGGVEDTLTPVPGTLEGAFTAPDLPGRYAVRCYTPADFNNGISESFKVEGR